MTEQLTEIRKRLSKVLKKERFEHTIGVMYTAASLAMRYGEDVEQAMTAGLLHDCGKFCPAKEQIKLCKKNGISLTESEIEMPALIHAKLGAYLARHEYGVKDKDVLSAVTYHTTGRPDMTMLEKIVYIADLTSAERDYPDALEVRELADRDLDAALRCSLEFTLKKMRANATPMTRDTLEIMREYGIDCGEYC